MDNAKIQVRTATRSDIPQILKLYAELQPHDDPIDAGAAASVWERAVSCGVAYFVADDDGRIAGTCYVAVIPNITRGCSPIGFIENVITAADYRRRGIGRMLVGAAVEHAKAMGCYKVTLQSGAKRTQAHRFYESVGFDGDAKRAYEIRF